MVTQWSAKATLSQICLSPYEILKRNVVAKGTKVALWPSLHMEEIWRLPIANCIQAGSPICLPIPHSWGWDGHSRPELGAKCAPFPVAAAASPDSSNRDQLW